jgi:hypothetical protein
LLETLEQLPDPGRGERDTDEQAHEELVARLRKHWQETDARCENLRREPASAEDFARSLHGHLARLSQAAPNPAEQAR